MLNWLKNKLDLAETSGMDLDDPSLTEMRRQVIRNKGYLRRIYLEWYGLLGEAIPIGPGDVIELGSGGGFIKDIISGIITTDVLSCSGVDRVLDACSSWPFQDNQLKAVVMVDVLHHIPDARIFFVHAQSAVRSGGTLAMIEPWVTPWSRLFYSRLHHEPFEPSTEKWSFPATGPLSGANLALAWVIFHRDRAVFEEEFPLWKIEILRPFLPFSYLLSGGVSMKSLMPGKMYRSLRLLERWSGAEQRMAMFAYIVLRRK